MSSENKRVCIEIAITVDADGVLCGDCDFSKDVELSGDRGYYCGLFEELTPKLKRLPGCIERQVNYDQKSFCWWCEERITFCKCKEK